MHLNQQPSMSSSRELNSYQKTILQRRSMRVLVVDDMAAMRRIIIAVLRQMGFEQIAEAGDGPRALQHVDNEPVDFLICDWNMPRMSGLELVHEFRKRFPAKRIPILMVTAEQSKEQVADAIRAGVTGYVVKPFPPTALKSHISKCLADAGS